MDAVSPPVNKIQWYEKPLIMPLRDIVKEYREAKNPKKQIDILADLNHTKSCRIAWLLDRCGEEASRRKRQKKADARAITCAVCHTYGGTMYKRGDGYICRDCRRKEVRK